MDLKSLARATSDFDSTTLASVSRRPTLSSPKSWLKGSNENQNADDKIGSLGLTTLSIPSCDAISVTVDVIFVHGLGGGSRKTWTKSGDAALYWPKEWLPYDEAFQDVRFHTFGYDSNWGKKSILSVHDFAAALLNSILDCPTIPRNTKTPLLFVGHSMGGLVIKRAYLMARSRQEYASLAARIQAVVFLATPHRGSDLAQVLSKLLSLVGGQRPFVNDLNRDSEALRTINEEFPERCQDLILYSFYETLPTNFGVKKSLVVERDLATMGYVNERRAYLNGDHREVCKYDSQTDPNYLTVRNALSAIVANLRDRLETSKRATSKERRQLLAPLLGIFDAPEDDFMSADSHRMDGSGEWLIKKENFQEWLNYDDPPIYSVTAKPATGKTILSGKVIAYLRHLKRPCSFYFFQHASKEKTSITTFLLSMAWQMAEAEEKIMNVCLSVFEKDDRLKTDYRSIWRKVFLEGIFKMKSEVVHYWIIDALDECENEAEMVSLLGTAGEVSFIHIFVTSRNRFESRQKLGKSQKKILFEEILEKDSRLDISMYLHANLDALPFDEEDDQQSIMYQILEKSRGCFLWVSLVVQELRRVSTSADKQRILDEVPEDMNELYARILAIMSKAQYGKEFTKAVLTWVACSFRPLKLAELHQALELDLQDSIDDLEKSIRSSCGQLVYIDTHGQVQMAHLTVRQFLLNAGTESEFTFSEKEGHRRLLSTILQHFNNEYVTKGSGRRRSSLEGMHKEGSAFIGYACEALGKHISNTSCMDKDILHNLANFFRTPNVLHWVEYITKHCDQQRLVETGEALGIFLQECPDQTSDDIALLNSWATDLVRLVMQFGKNLEAYPASIFHLIPPFCPSATALRRQFGSAAHGITVRGLRAETWDNCLATIIDSNEQYSGIACSNTQFAIGCSSGKIFIFKQMTCQKAATLQHDEPVTLLILGKVRNILVSAGSKKVHIWDLQSNSKLQTFSVPQQCMALALDCEDQLLLGALKDHCLNFWNLKTGGPPDSINWTKGLERMTIHLWRRPNTAAFGIDSNILAVIYKGQDILLWSLSSDEFLALYSRESGRVAESLGRPYGSSGVRCLTFGNGANAHLLACAYTDGELVLFDTSLSEVKRRIVVFAHILACSADGRVLATADPAGTIQLFKFDTLQFIYRISPIESGIQDLSFSQDGTRLLDIRGSRCRVWNLADQLKESQNKLGISTTDSMDLVKQTYGDSESSILITAIATGGNNESFFVAKENGSVYIYAINSGLPIRVLFSHVYGISIVSLYFDDQSNTLTTVDSSSRVMVHKLKGHGQSMSVSQVVFDQRIHVALRQVVYQPGLRNILLCSATADTLWSLSPSGNVLVKTLSFPDREPARWSKHPQKPTQLILVQGYKAYIYDWNTLERLTRDSGIELKGIHTVPQLSISSIVPCFNGTTLATKFRESNKPNGKSKLYLWSTSDFTPDAKSATPTPDYHALSEDIEIIVGNTSSNSGSSAERLVFLHSSQWICAADVESAKQNKFVKHFFFPADWIDPRRVLDLKLIVTKNGDLLLVKHDEVAIVSRGLLTTGFAVEGDIQVPSARASLLARKNRKSHALNSSIT